MSRCLKRGPPDPGKGGLVADLSGGEMAARGAGNGFGFKYR